MEVAILIAGATIFSGLLSVSAKLGEIHRDFRYANTVLSRLAKTHQKLRKALAPTQSEMWDDDVYGSSEDEADSFGNEDAPVRFLRELREIAWTNRRLVDTLDAKLNDEGGLESMEDVV